MTNNKVLASYNGSQRGFTVRNLQLEQESFVNGDFNFQNIIAGPNNDVYLPSANHIYNYDLDGKLIKDMAFPDAGIDYTGIAIKGDRVYATYEGTQVGVSIRDLALNQISFFATNFKANGIATGPNNDLYLAADNHIYHYNVDGTLIQDMIFPDASINYTDVTVIGERVYASYNGSQEGFTVRDLQLKQLSFVNTGFNINSIAAGPDNVVYLTSTNHIYNYHSNGTLLKNMEFSDDRINYTGVSVNFTSLT